ncbi:uncharacterized protein LOC126394074 isoform X2 [Epinephelus moara]|uniref:uncharacterized protein LOC126394074 isoform X2 n=1 Tax=Epinephelus moara TaxID=300413 RepID=UPI00214F0B22|nr:uncharacterized protein LOC126394074 isoform X2 [Epinephelus moara]
MTRSCYAVNCTNRQNDGWKLYNIPRGSHPFAKRRRRLWIQAIKRADWGPEGPKGGKSLCSAHFVSGMFVFANMSWIMIQILFHHCSTLFPETPQERWQVFSNFFSFSSPQSNVGFLNWPSAIKTLRTPALDSSEDERKFVSRKEMHQLNLQYNQLRDDYEALKRELYATQEENKHLKEQLKQSKFGFDSTKDTNAKIIFFNWFTVITNVYVAAGYCKKKHTCA